MKFILALIFQSWSALILAQLPDAFLKAIGTDNIEQGVDIVEGVDGNVFVLSATNAVASSNTDILVSRLDENFNCIWSYTYGGAFIEMPKAMDVSSNGDLIVVSTVLSTTTQLYDTEVMKLDADGNMLWQRMIGGADWDLVSDVRVVGSTIYVLDNSVIDGVSQVVVHKLDLDTGASFSDILMTDDMQSSFAPCFLIENGRIFIIIESNNGDTTSLNSYYLNGVLQWSTPVVADNGGEITIKDLNSYNTNIYYVGERNLEDAIFGFWGGVNVLGSPFIQVSDDLSGNYGYSGIDVSDARIALVGYLEFAGAGAKDGFVHILTTDGIFLGAPTFGDAQNDYFSRAYFNEDGAVFAAGTTFSYGEANGNAFALKMTEATFGDYDQFLDTDNSCFIVSVNERLQEHQKKVVSTKYYLLDGREIDEMQFQSASHNTIIIVREVFSDGTIQARKIVPNN